ncbi:SMP-30/gluconolactonase/LRE family protein [Maribacter chungangensis]|uniref:SMP-30/gluconolactonase/LRE family protein n=1 Tax=Maribacter chungangensis TaxID=1069117 RepID=A0ABW3B150_9FLAO
MRSPIPFAFLILLFVSCNSLKKPIISNSATPILVQDGYAFTEGPASDKEGNVYFTDQPNNSILKWDAKTNTVSTFMKPAGRANGLYVDNQGNLLAAADEKNELWQIDMDKKVRILLHHFENKKLNGPNDIWVDKKGGIYFTDPYYQRPYWERKEAELDAQLVYYIAPNSTEAKVVADNFERPNGIIGTADGKTLYISDIGDKKTYSYTIANDGSLTNRKLFTNMGSDGMTIDNKGNVYLTGEGVTVFNAQGKQIEHIPIAADWTANVTFGGAEQNILFITASKAIYTLTMSVNGVRW